MKNDRSILEKMIRKALTGEDSHVEVKKILEGLDWQMVGARRKHRSRIAGCNMLQKRSPLTPDPLPNPLPKGEGG